MSLKLKLGASALGVLAASLTAQTAFAAGAGPGGAGGAGGGPGSVGAIAVRCGVVKLPPRHQVVRPLCCPPVVVVYPVTRHQAPKPVTLVTAFCCAGPLRPFPVPRQVSVAPASVVAASVVPKPAKGQPVARVVVFAGCAAQVVVFDAAADGSVFTEVRGPRLADHEPILYRGRIYQVASVSGKHFTLDYRGRPYHNDGPAIHDGRAVVLPYIFYMLTHAPCR